MSFIKTQSVEKVQVVPAKEAKTIESKLTRIGKTSAKELTDEERVTVFDKR